MGKILCVIYDCDGVLFDSLEANGRLYSDVCVSLGRSSPLTQEELHYVHSHTVYEAIQFITRNDHDLEEKARGILKQIDLRKYVRYLKMEPHLLETLSQLKERRILRAVNTNRTTSMPYIMEDFKLGPYFDMVVTALDVKNPKPHPEPLLKILEFFGLHADEALFVGDSDLDRMASEAAGVPFVAYKAEMPCIARIDRHADILKLTGTTEGGRE